MYKVFTEKEKEELLIKYDMLIKNLANKYMDKDWGFDDTYQELRMIFLKMLNKYDPEKGEITTLFYKYVHSWFTGALMQYKYAQKRIPYKAIISADKISDSASKKTGKVDKDDFFSFMESSYETPETIERNERINDFIVSEMKKLTRPALLIGMLIHGRSLEDMQSVYNAPLIVLEKHYYRNLNKLKKIVKSYLEGEKNE